jgi:hypothetical protein
VRGVGGGVPCARSSRTGTRSSVAIVKVADRRTGTYVRTPAFVAPVCRNALTTFLRATSARRFCRNICVFLRHAAAEAVALCLPERLSGVPAWGALCVTKKRPRRSPLAAAPPPRAPGAPPQSGVPSSPSVHPVKQAPPIRPTRAPRQRPVAKVPHPRRPEAVRAKSGALGDLFAVFRDLPRPRRPLSHTVKRPAPSERQRVEGRAPRR